MRMNRVVLSMALLVLPCVVPATVKAQEMNSSIVFINLDSVFTNYHKTKLAEAQLKDQADEIKSERKGLIDQLDEIQRQYQTLRTQAQSTALNDDARNQKRAEAEEKLIEVRDMESKIRRLEESAQRKIDDQSRRARKRLVEEINEVIKGFASTRGYTAIIDMSGESLNGVPTVVYYNPKLDITEEVIALVNAGK